MSGIITHFCNIGYGESVGGMIRDAAVVPAAESTLYSGRIYYQDSQGRAIGGATGPNQQLYIAHRGVDHPDIVGLLSLTDRMTGATKGKKVSGIPCRSGLRVLTSEYRPHERWDNLGAPVSCDLDSGKFQIASGPSDTGEVIGCVAEVPHRCHGLKVVGVRIRQAVFRAGWSSQLLDQEGQILLDQNRDPLLDEGGS